MKKVLSEKERLEIARTMRGRILNVLPAASYQMDKFLQLVDVVVSDETPSACVEIGPQPRLHLNKDFVEEYCQRDECLLMLILHELYHIILGHTRLFPRTTEAHNIVFDAVINALLCHQFPDPQYTEFFQRVNDSKGFPARILRPPKGWPSHPALPPKKAPNQERAVMKLLYGSNPNLVTYQEIFELFKEQLKDRDETFVLLGDHGGEKKSGSKDQVAVNDDLFKDILRRTTENWPDKANQRFGKGKGGKLSDFMMPKPKSPRTEFLEALKRLLRKTGVLYPPPGSPYAWKRVSTMQDAMTFLPTLRDRHALSKEMLLGFAPLTYRTEINRIHPRWTPQNVAHVYLDVSGSMEDALPWLSAALDPLHRKGLCRLYAFSTVVDEVRKGRLLSGQIKNTLGTDINCVYRHLLDIPVRHSPSRVVVLTDGYTGVPESKLHNDLERRRVSLYIGIVGSHQDQQLKPFANAVEHLPKFN